MNGWMVNECYLLCLLLAAKCEGDAYPLISGFFSVFEGADRSTECQFYLRIMTSVLLTCIAVCDQQMKHFHLCFRPTQAVCIVLLKHPCVKGKLQQYTGDGRKVLNAGVSQNMLNVAQ